jgi:diacylglycerol kinase (ATP)
MQQERDAAAMKSTSALNPARIFRAYVYSLKGLTAAWQQEPAFKQEIGFFAVMLPLTLWLRLPKLDTVLIVALMGLVLAVELLNSGLEALVDKTSPEFHPLAGKAKDCGSAAVLIALLVFLIAWCVLALPALLVRFG